MTDTDALGTTASGQSYADAARDHLWMHFTRHSVLEPVASGGLGAKVPIILTSRADSSVTKLASCALAVKVAAARKAGLIK